MIHNASLKVFAENRRAKFDYEILETYTAGVELLGGEVKSIKTGRLNLSGSYAIIRGEEIWLINAQIPAYQPKNTPADYDPARTRRLLLTHAEIKELSGRIKEKGLSLIPLDDHLQHGLIKIKLGLGQSLKKRDKRSLIKKRETDREIRRME